MYLLFIGIFGAVKLVRFEGLISTFCVFLRTSKFTQVEVASHWSMNYSFLLASYQCMNSYLCALSSEMVDHFHFHIQIVFALVIMLSTCYYFRRHHVSA